MDHMSFDELLSFYPYGYDKHKRTVMTEAESLLRHGFERLCVTILRPDSKKELFKAYDALFEDYGFHLLYGDDLCASSLLEDVIIKIMNEENEDLYTKYGIIYTPFDKLMAFARKQDAMIRDFINEGKGNNGGSRSSVTVANACDKLIKKPMRRLSTYLYIYLTEHTNPLQSSRLKDCIYKNFKDIGYEKNAEGN